MKNVMPVRSPIPIRLNTQLGELKSDVYQNVSAIGLKEVPRGLVWRD